MLRVGIFCPVGVPRANYALTHAFGAVNYNYGVGITSLVYYKGCGRPRITNEQKPDTPLFFCSQRNINLTSPILGVWRADYKMKNRFYYLDNICCVLILHMIYTCHIAHASGVAKTSVISIIGTTLSFFMSWFFFKGGMMHKETKLKDIIRKSTKRLLIPYLIFLIIGIMLDILFFKFEHDLPLNTIIFLKGEIVLILSTSTVWPTAAIWFLISLYFTRITFNLLYHKIHPLILTIFFAFASYVIYIIYYNGWSYDIHFVGSNSHIQFPQFYIGNICHGLSLYSLGHYLQDKQFNKKVFIMASILFMMKYFIPAGIDFRANLSSGTHFMLAVLYEMTGCIVINNLFRQFLNHKIIFITHIGSNSMVYYLIHFPVMCTIGRLYLKYEDYDIWPKFFILSFMVTISLFLAEWIFRHKKFRFIIGG